MTCIKGQHGGTVFSSVASKQEVRSLCASASLSAWS